MTKLFTFLTTAGILGASGISQSNTASESNNLGVTNGVNAKEGNASFFCTVTAKENYGTITGLGGTLISPWWVLSCAHDVVSLQKIPGHAKLIFNMYDSQHINYKNIVQRTSQKIIINPTWLKDGTHSDISLIKLNKPIYNIKPAALPKSIVKTGDMEKVFGYGISSVNSKGLPVYDNHLKVGTIPVVDGSLGAKYPWAKFDPKLEMLAGSDQGKRIGAALGDSGGPLISYHNGSPVLDGVVSRGTQHYSYGWVKPAFGIYSSTYDNLLWIKNTMAKN